jgi:hypothetical protein
MATVREFVFQVYRLINASNPTVSLHGDDEKLAIQVLNQLLKYYASTGLMLTIAKTVTVPVNLPIKEIYFTDRNYPTTTTQIEVVTLTTGSPDFTVAHGGLYAVGDTVTGTGIPALTEILSISGNVITLDANATTTGASSLTFTHDNSDPSVVYIKEGRLANLNSAWLQLDGVTYPLINESRDEFLASWKYEPLQGLPRFIVVFPETQIVRAQLYPAPSQFFQFFARGKFQLDTLTSNDSMDSLPGYFERFLLFAVAKDVSMYKGRAEAWTAKHEEMLINAKDIMESASEVNLAITGDREDLLNGAWRVRSGV